jgi:hypothetical protein
MNIPFGFEKRAGELAGQPLLFVRFTLWSEGFGTYEEIDGWLEEVAVKWRRSRSLQDKVAVQELFIVERFLQEVEGNTSQTSLKSKIAIVLAGYKERAGREE